MSLIGGGRGGESVCWGVGAFGGVYFWKFVQRGGDIFYV